MITSAEIEAYYNITLTTEQKARLDDYIIPALTSFTEKYCNRSFGLGSDFGYRYEATVLPELDGWDIATVGNGTYDIVGGKLLYIIAGTTGQAYKRIDPQIDFNGNFTFEIRAKFDGIFQKSDYPAEPSPQIEILDRINGKALRLVFYEDAIISANGTRVDIDTDVTQYHTIKVTIIEGVAKLYLDGVATDINLGGASLGDGENYIRILDNNQAATGEDMESYYDYIYYSIDNNYIETFDGGDASLFVHNPPINQINSVKVDDAELTADEYKLYETYVRLLSTPTNHNTEVEINYKGGFDPIPQDVQNMMIKWSYAVMTDDEADSSGGGSTADIKRFQAGSVTVEYADSSASSGTGGAGVTGTQVFGVPDYVINILQYYRLTPII